MDTGFGDEIIGDDDPTWDFSADPQTSNDEVRIDGIEYPVLNGRVNVLNLGRFQNKTTFGDYSFDSDPLLSSEIFSSFTGGQGNETIKEGVDDDSFWEANLETRFPDGATLLPLTRSYPGEGVDAAIARPIGDFPADVPKFHAAFDNSLEQWNPTTLAFESFATLPQNPVDLGVEFDDLFFIPLGANGYVTVTTAGVVVHDADLHVLQFVLYDLKLAALTIEGNLLFRLVGGTFPATAPERTLPKGQKPRKMVNFINQRGDPTLHIVTTKTVYAYDPDGEVLYQTRLEYPKHPDQGLGAVNWRGDSMFVSVGLGIHGYNGSIVQSMGPDGRHGLPARHRGRIVDLAGEYNALLALVEGIADSSSDTADIEEEYLIQTPLYQNKETWAISGLTYSPVFSTILRWSNSQWHKVWESETASGIPTQMAISEAEPDYRLWWGYGPNMYTQILPRASQNPKQYLKSGEQEFMPTGKLITGWFDADMAAFDKLATHMEVNLFDIDGAGETGGTVGIEYQFDDGATWAPLGVADTVGLTILPFQNEFRQSGIPFSKGLAWNRIRFRFAYDQKTVVNPETSEVEYQTRYSPLAISIILKFIKIPNSQLSWSFTIDLTSMEGYKKVGVRELARRLDAHLTSREMITFGYLDEEYRVRMAQVNGDRDTGYDLTGNYNVNLVEVRLGEDRRNSVVKYVDIANA